MCAFCRSLINTYKKQLGLDSQRVPINTAVTQFAEALARAWTEYNNPRSESDTYMFLLKFAVSVFHFINAFIHSDMFYRAAVLFVVQPEERNMYDQHWFSLILNEKYPFLIIRLRPICVAWSSRILFLVLLHITDTLYKE